METVLNARLKPEEKEDAPRIALQDTLMILVMTASLVIIPARLAHLAHLKMIVILAKLPLRG